MVPMIDYDTAISGLFRAMYRMPANVSRSQFRRGMRRVWIVQIVGAGLWVGFVWFAEMMRSLA